MKLFLSWSGDRSQKLAGALKDWLPLVLHYAEPWVSKSDIEAGERWATEVGKELESSNFGIICITSENVNSPWILFESGALSKSMQEGRVVPLLLDLDFKDIAGPLAQFQSKKVEHAGVWDLVIAINKLAASPVPESRLRQLFDKLFSDLTSAIESIPAANEPGPPKRPQQEVLEELVTSVRGLDGRLRDAAEGGLLRRRRLGMGGGPEAAFETMRSVSRDPRDPLRFVVFGSYFKEDVPWLYELAMETYRTTVSGTRKQALEAQKRLARALDSALHGPSLRWLDSKEAHFMIMEGREMLRLGYDLDEVAHEDTSAKGE